MAGDKLTPTPGPTIDVERGGTVVESVRGTSGAIVDIVIGEDQADRTVEQVGPPCISDTEANAEGGGMIPRLPVDALSPKEN